jgi:hypothetical protein
MSGAASPPTGWLAHCGEFNAPKYFQDFRGELSIRPRLVRVDSERPAERRSAGRRRIIMGRIVVTEFVSLDGVVLLTYHPAAKA